MIMKNSLWSQIMILLVVLLLVGISSSSVEADTANYDIEQSTDLQSWLPCQSFNLPLTNLPPDKAFIRIKAKQ